MFLTYFKRDLLYSPLTKNMMTRRVIKEKHPSKYLQTHSFISNQITISSYFELYPLFSIYNKYG